MNNLPESECMNFVNQHEIDINLTKWHLLVAVHFERKYRSQLGSGAPGRNSQIPEWFLLVFRISQVSKRRVIQHISPLTDRTMI